MSGTTENVDLKATADMAAVLTALQQIGIGLDRIAQSNKKIGESAGNLDNAVNRAVEFGQRILGIGTAYAIASKAQQAFFAELEAYHERTRKAGEFHVAEADLQNQYLQLATERGKVTANQARQRAKDIASRTIQAPDTVHKTLLSTIGSMSDSDDPMAPWNAAEAALEHKSVRGGTDETTGALANAIGQVMRVWPERSAREVLAAIVKAEKAASMEKPDDFYHYMIPAIAQARAFGNGKDEFADLASMFISVGARSGDFTGATTQTWGGTFLKQLKIETTKAGLKDASVMEQLRFLREDPKGQTIAKSLLGPFYAQQSEVIEKKVAAAPQSFEWLAKRLGGADIDLKSGRNKNFIASVELLQPEGVKNTTRESERKYRGQIPAMGDPQAVRDYEDAQRQIRSIPSQQTARSSASLKTLAEQTRDNETTGAVTGKNRADLTDALDALGEGAIRRRISMLEYNTETMFGIDPSQATINQLIDHLPEIQYRWNGKTHAPYIHPTNYKKFGDVERAILEQAESAKMRGVEINPNQMNRVKEIRSLIDSDSRATPASNQGAGMPIIQTWLASQAVGAPAAATSVTAGPAKERTDEIVKGQREMIAQLDKIASSLERLVQAEGRPKSIVMSERTAPERRAVLGIDQAARSPK